VRKKCGNVITFIGGKAEIPLSSVYHIQKVPGEAGGGRKQSYPPPPPFPLTWGKKEKSDCQIKVQPYEEKEQKYLHK
jgi:hypothetical protein